MGQKQGGGAIDVQLATGLTEIEAMKDFKQEVEKSWKQENVNNIEEMDDSLQKCADVILKRMYKRRVRTENDEIVMEKPWFTEEIRAEIKKKRDLNRRKRNCNSNEEKEILTNEWKIQKTKTHLKIREAIERYEIKLTDEKMSGQKSCYWLRN